MRIAVAGGTGTVGAQVVAAVRRFGHEPVVLSRSTGVDLGARGANPALDAALDGVESVIDVVNTGATGRKDSVRFFESTSTALLQAGRRAGVRHHVALSIVGIDRADFAYYAGKRRQEELVLAPTVPGSVLRATQFHDFVPQVLARTPGPIAVVPRMRVQSVDPAEVAADLVRLAQGEPVGMAGELAGPEVAELPELARRYLQGRLPRRYVWAVRLPVRGAREMAEGALLPTGSEPRAVITFDQWLAARRTARAAR